MVLSGCWCSRTWRCLSCLAGELYRLVVSGLGVGQDGSRKRELWWVVGDLGRMGYVSKLVFEITLDKLGAGYGYS